MGIWRESSGSAQSPGRWKGTGMEVTDNMETGSEKDSFTSGDAGISRHSSDRRIGLSGISPDSVHYGEYVVLFYEGTGSDRRRYTGKQQIT